MVEHKRLVSRVKRQRESLSSSYRDGKTVEPIPNRASSQIRVLGVLLILFFLRGLRTVCPPSFLTVKRKVNLKNRVGVFLAVFLPLVFFCATAYAAEGDIRLGGVKSSTENGTIQGYLEVEHNGAWKGVCDDYFTDDDAEVACRQLRYISPGLGKALIHLDGPSDDFGLDNLLCAGSETMLIDCRRSGNIAIGSHNCRDSEYAGAVCYQTVVTPKAPENLVATDREKQNMIMLEWNTPYFILENVEKPVHNHMYSIVTGYKIEVSEDGGNNWEDLVSNTNSVVSNTNSERTEYFHQGLSHGDTRHYRVSAINSAGTSDPSNIASATVGVATEVPETNRAPEFPSGTPTAFSVNENTRAGENIGDRPVAAEDPEGETLTYRLDEGDGDSFAVDSTGQIKTKGPLDYEDKSSYTVVVKVTDGKTEVTTTVAIGVNNMEEDGIVTLSNYSPQVGIGLTAMFDGDPDGNVTNFSWQWQKRANGGNWSNIPGATSASYTPGTGDLNHLLRAKASYTDGYGSGMAYADSNEAVMDTCPQNNAPPEIVEGGTATRSVLEGGSRSNVGAPVTATDSDSGHQIRLAYSLDNGDGASFDIDSSGQIKTKLALDYETKSSYSVTVTVTDPCGLTDTIEVTINVNEVVSPPSNTETPSQITRSTPTATVPRAPASLTATRGDGEVTLNWRAPGDGGSAIKYYEYKVDDGEWTSTGGKSTSYTVTGLTNGETYRFRVRAVNSVGHSLESKPAIATPATVPGAPRNLTATPGDQRMTLIWERPTDNGGLPITSYQYIQKEEDGSFGSWVSIDDSGPRGANETSYTVTGLKNGTIYSFRVRAVNALGPGDPSAEATAEPSTSAFRRARRASLNILPTFGRTMLRNSVDALTWRLDSVLSGSFERTGMFRLMDQHAGLHEVLGNDIWDDPDQWEDLSLEELLYGSSFIIEAGVMLRKPKEHPKEAPKEYKGYTEEDSREHIREYPEEDSADKNMWIDKDEKPMVAERRGGIGFWGKADYNNLSVSSDEWFAWDGQIVSGYMGVDRWLNEKVLTGLSVSLTKGDFDYTDTTPGEGGRGDYYVKMLSVSPYVSWFLSDDAYLWGSVGYGRGQVDIDDEDVQSVATSDLSYKSVAAGGSGRLFDVGDTTFSLKSEAFKVWMDVEGDDYLIDELSIGVHQLRLSMEGSYEYRFASGTWFNPLVEVALRHDGGDGETGTGVELGGGFLYEDPNLGLSVSGRGRWLAAHSSDEFSQWGVGGAVIFDTGADKQGALFSVSPEWGDTSSGVDSLWERGVEGLSSEDGGANDMHLDAEFGYGLSALGGDGLFTPYSGLRVGGDGWRQYRLGSRLDLGRSASLSLETDRRQSDTTKPEHGIMLRGKLNF